MSNAAKAIPKSPASEWAREDANWFRDKSRHNLMLLRRPYDGEIDDENAAYPLLGNESYHILVRFKAGGAGKVSAKSIVALENRHLPGSMTDEQIVELVRKNAHRVPQGVRLCG